MNPGLVPGAKALTLPTPHSTPLYYYREVTVLTAPQLEGCTTATGGRYLVVCLITMPTELPPPAWPDAQACWPASALLPLPGDKDAEQFTREAAAPTQRGVPA